MREKKIKIRKIRKIKKNQNRLNSHVTLKIRKNSLYRQGFLMDMTSSGFPLPQFPIQKRIVSQIVSAVYQKVIPVCVTLRLLGNRRGHEFLFR
jgi:hypothetical protein